MALRGLAELWPGEVMIFVHELPGCFSAASTLDEAQAMLRSRVDEHVIWLNERGLGAPVGTGPEVEIVEQLEPVAGRYGPLFELDCDALTVEEIAYALTVGAAAREGLLGIYRDATLEVRARCPAEGEWSINEHLLHIAEADCYYLSGHLDEPVADLLNRIPDNPEAALLASGDLADQTLRGLNGPALSQVVSTGQEAWTPRKTLRRMVAHLREHDPWVRELARG